MTTYLQKKIENIKTTLGEMSGGYRRMVATMADLGFSGTMKAIWDDLFAHRSFASGCICWFQEVFLSGWN